jgi:hypothetical protein
MENTNTIINNKEDEKKQKNLEARRRAARAFHERNKDNEVLKLYFSSMCKFNL